MRAARAQRGPCALRDVPPARNALLVATAEPELMSSPVEGWEAVKDILVGITPSPLGALVCRVCREDMLRYVVQPQAALWGMLAACFDLR
jgi:hypothetical protein